MSERPGSGEPGYIENMNRRTAVLSIARTPIGSFQGAFSGVPAWRLGKDAISGAIGRSGVAADAIDEVWMGCVLGAGQGQAPARQAAIAGGLPESVGATTVNKMCGSGLKAVMMADDAIRCGRVRYAVAGGMESMTEAPYLIPKARGGYRYGHGTLVDHLAMDGLEDAYDRGTPMGVFAERTAAKYGFDREAQDAFAIESLRRAQAAIDDGAFDGEVVPVSVAGRKETVEVSTDEQPGRGRPDKIPTLRPAFQKDGTVTAANASSISDGAAALVVADHDAAVADGREVLATIVGQASHACAPSSFTTAPVGAIGKLLDSVDWSAGDVDLWEINEAFAVVTMAAMREHSIDDDRVNVHGGACALGHPIGASGARILVTLIAAMRRRGVGRGVATLCIGGGEAVAVAVQCES